MKELEWLFLAMVVVVLGSVGPAFSLGNEVPTDCNGSGMNVGLTPSNLLFLDGETVQYIIDIGVGNTACDAGDVDVYFFSPGNPPNASTCDATNGVLVAEGLYIEQGAHITLTSANDVNLAYVVDHGDEDAEGRIFAYVCVKFVAQTDPVLPDESSRSAVDVVIHPGTLVGISASPMEVVPIGTDVKLTITEKNTGDANLGDPYVELEPLGLILDKNSGDYFGGDTDGDGELGVGETWTWIVDDNDVSDTETYWATGHGIDPLGNDVTWCEYPAEPPAETLCDANEANEVTVYRMNPATEVGIWAWPMEVSPVGTDVTLTITEENTGDANLTDPCVVLEPLDVTLTKGSADYNDGDTDGDGELDVGEMWTWIVVDSGVDADKTYTVTGHGRDPLNNEVTWCSNPGDPPADTMCDANEQDEVTVSVIYCSTLVDISASPAEVVPIGTDVTLTITEENIGDCNLADPCVVLEPLGLTLTKASPHYDSGDDDGDGELDVYEQWTWTVADEDVNDTRTYTATGHGIDPLGNDVSWCANWLDPPADTLCDANEQ
ncbi:MAG: hypothetical protein ACYS0H_23975, partial [Planctomycetota bacterium]